MVKVTVPGPGKVLVSGPSGQPGLPVLLNGYPSAFVTGTPFPERDLRLGQTDLAVRDCDRAIYHHPIDVRRGRGQNRRFALGEDSA